MNLKYISFIVMTTPILVFAQARIPLYQSETGSPFNQSKFVPDISMIVDFSWLSRDLGDDIFSELLIPGFTHQHQKDDENDDSNSRKGFNLNYGELTFYSVVDPYFDLFAVLHAAPEHAGLEEAYITTRQLPYGFQIKAGKFLSGFGRLNEQHTHYLDFVDRPLVLKAFFGEEGLNESGARLTWVAPTDFYLMLGTEILTGENESSFGNTGFRDPKGMTDVKPDQGPQLSVNYFRSSVDLGEAAILFGISYAHGSTRMDENFSETGGSGSAVAASTDILSPNLTVKYSVDAIRYLAFQSEYLYRFTKGSLYSRDTALTVEKNSLKKQQAGFYSQLAVKIALRWRAGVRYDLLNLNAEHIGVTTGKLPHHLTRYSAMVEYNPTEFSRLRMQLNHDRSQYLLTSDGSFSKPFSEIIIQLNIAIGAHGAHSF